MKDSKTSIIKFINSTELYNQFFNNENKNQFENLNCDIYFIRGNHEDHSSLISLKKIPRR